MVTAVPAGRLAAAYDACESLARHHYENFPVASLLLPRAMRPHVAAVYAFARVADDFADEGVRPAEERLAALDAWGRRLVEATSPLGGHPPTRPPGGHGEAGAGPPPLAGGPPPLDGHYRAASGSIRPLFLPAESDAIFLALADTIARCRLPISPFEDLLSAFRQDVLTRRYGTWAELLDYCRRSADPVGRIVLRIAGYHDGRLDASSDALCTALQLTNFWQDLERDRDKGRLYVPLEECAAVGANPADLHAGRLTPAWRAALAQAATRTEALFEAGRPVCDGVTGRLRWELRLTWLGGRRILERLREADFDVFRHRPTLGPFDAARLGWRALSWRTAT
jgi:phytoene synthase